MGTPASLTFTLRSDKEVEIAKEVSEDEEDVDDRLETIPELPQGARVRRKPQLPVQVGGGGRGGDEEEEEKAPSTIEHLLSAGRGPKDGEKELGAMVTSHDEDDGGSECSESDEDSSEGDARCVDYFVICINFSLLWIR